MQSASSSSQQTHQSCLLAHNLGTAGPAALAGRLCCCSLLFLLLLHLLHLLLLLLLLLLLYLLTSRRAPGAAAAPRPRRASTTAGGRGRRSGRLWPRLRQQQLTDRVGHGHLFWRCRLHHLLPIILVDNLHSRLPRGLPPRTARSRRTARWASATAATCRPCSCGSSCRLLRLDSQAAF
jgi:hypothetical protein